MQTFNIIDKLHWKTYKGMGPFVKQKVLDAI